MLILGIETSCDETAAAVVEDGRRILSSKVSSQVSLHEKFGGVVPEIASRAHCEYAIPIVDAAMKDAGVSLRDLGAVAVTAGPGLIGALLVGVTMAKTLGWAVGVPVIAVDHLEAHIYAANLSHDVEYPFVTLLASGGHTALYLSKSPTEHAALGRTVDDAAGEAFDKVSAMLSLGYPGGPAVERAAREGNPRAVAFPRAMMAEGSLDFSFSGIKTSVLYYVKGQNAKGAAAPFNIADTAASFQEAVVEVLVAKLMLAAHATRVSRLALAGGVAANGALRERLAAEAAARGYTLYIPPVSLCTDNAATVAGLAFHRIQKGEGSDLRFDAYARQK